MSTSPNFRYLLGYLYVRQVSGKIPFYLKRLRFICSQKTHKIKTALSERFFLLLPQSSAKYFLREMEIEYIVDCLVAHKARFFRMCHVRSAVDIQ